MPCVHGRQRSRCKECGGGGLCEHGRDRSRCKECGGGGLCEHGRQRSKCKECGGGGLCEHGRARRRGARQCKECAASASASASADGEGSRDLASIYAAALRKQAQDQGLAPPAIVTRPCVRCHTACTWPAEGEAAASGDTCLYCRRWPTAGDGSCAERSNSGGGEGGGEEVLEVAWAEAETAGDAEAEAAGDAYGEHVVVLSAVLPAALPASPLAALAVAASATPAPAPAPVGACLAAHGRAVDGLHVHVPSK